MKKSSLRKKILLVTLPVLTATVLLVFLFNLAQLKALYLQTLADQGLIVGRNLRDNVYRQLKYYRLSGFGDMVFELQELSRTNREIDFAFVADRDGLILYHNDVHFVAETLNDAQRPILKPDPATSVLLTTECCLETVLPIIDHGQVIGTIHVGMDRRRIDSHLRDTLYYSLAVLLGALGLSSALVYGLLTRGIIRPMRRLTESVARIGALDDLSQAVPETGEDEIGQLGAAFNQMTARLKISFDEIDRQTRELRSLETVEERNRLLAAENFQRQRAEAALLSTEARYRQLYEESRRAEELYRRLLQSTPDAIVIYDLDGLAQYVNPAFTKIFGWTLAEVAGRHIPFLPDSEREPSMAVITAVLTVGIACAGFETKRFTKDGRLMDVSISASKYDNHEGRPAGMLVILRDISERKRAEMTLQDLSQKREELERIINRSPAVVFLWLVAPGWPVEFVSDNVRQFGYNPEDFYSRRLLYDNIIHPEDLEYSTADFQKECMLSGQDSYNQEYRILTADGQVRWLDDRSWVRRNASGQVTHVQGIILDITEKRLVEGELTRTKNYLQNIIDSMPSVLVGVDVEGRVTEWNAEARRITGLDSADVRGRPLPQVFPWLVSQMERIRECMGRKTTVVTEKYPKMIMGEIQYLDMVFFPLVANGVTGAVIRMDDVTSRVRIEEMMVQTEKMMSVGGLAAGMAHEINNPLGGIIQGAQNIKRRLSPALKANLEAARASEIDLERLADYLNTRQVFGFIDGILDAGQRAARIVSNMLEFSRRSDSEKKPVRLDELLDKAVELAASDYDLRRQYDFRHVRIERQYDPNLPPVCCEPTKIEQVVLNLLRNAAQAMGESSSESGGREGTEGPRIILRTRLDGSMARFEVADNGPGMAEEVRRRVFEPFFTTKPVGVGTGLGLSVSYFIITENHQGSMSVESRPGQGSTFIIRLPVQGAD